MQRISPFIDRGSSFFPAEIGKAVRNVQEELKRIDRVIESGPYRDDWASLSAWRVPQWYEQIKFGIFIHWGVFSVPAFDNEWYSRNMYIKGSRAFEHHVKTYGPQSVFGYKDFIPLFRAERFDPDAWAELFRRAGAQYVIPVAEHHDGFQMYKSQLSHYNAFEMGPKRDVLGELSRACRDRGIIAGASSHRIEHWFFMGHGKDFDSDIHEPLRRGDFYWPAMPEGDHMDIASTPEPTKEFLDDWLLRTCEIIDQYHPSIIYFDWWIQHRSAKPYLKKLAAYYYNRSLEWGQPAVINYKFDAFPFGTAVPDVERGQFAEMKSYAWQADTSVARNSWCYTEGNQYREPADLVCDLVDIVSKNGRLLLNIGPKADGTIPDRDAAILEEIGRWLSVNGEAITGAGVWKKYGEGPTQIPGGHFAEGKRKPFTSADFRFTTANGALYVTALKASEDGVYDIHTLGMPEDAREADFNGVIRSVSVLGTDEPVSFSRGRTLQLQTDFRSDMPVVFKICID